MLNAGRNGSTEKRRRREPRGLVEGLAGEGVDGVARVSAGDLLLASNVGAGRISATKVVHEDRVRPISLDGGITVVHALTASDRAVDAGGHVGNLVVGQPGLAHVGSVDVGST
jgi:hypothetical protein